MEPKNTKQHPLTALALLEVGIFELGFVTIVLILLFSTLNYFNILPVSDVFPQYLGWLPKQSIKLASQGESLRSYKDISSPTPQSTAFTQEDAERVFSAFVSQNLTPSLIKSNNFYPITSSSLEKDAFDYIWTAKSSTLSAHFKLSSDNKGFLYLNLSIVTPQNTTPSAEFSAKIASQFFIIYPQDVWKCKTVNELISCENFWKDKNDIKKGINVAGPVIVNNNQKIISLSFCQIHKDSPLYENTSCLR